MNTYKNIILILVFVCLIVLSGCTEYKQCTSPLEKKCYKYIGHMLSTEEKQVSCSKDYDFYINSSTDWTNCNPIYNRGYD